VFQPLLKLLFPSTENPGKPSFRSCAVGCVFAPLALVLILCVIALPFWWDILVVPTLIIPDHLGMLRHITPDEAITLDYEMPTVYILNLSHAGTYVVFCSDDVPMERLVARYGNNGRDMNVTPISKINLYGSRAVPGTPIAEFKVERAGSVEISLNRFDGAKPRYTFLLVPSFAEKNSLVITVSAILHIIVVGLVLGGAYYFFNQEDIRRHQTNQQQKRDNLDKMVEIANRVNRPKNES
jgi:hypothetical protein